MPDIYKNMIGSLVRWLMSGAAGYLIAHGWLTTGQADQLLFTLGLAISAIGLSLWQKYRQKLKLFTALEMPAGSTPAQVNEVIAETPAADNRAKVLETT